MKNLFKLLFTACGILAFINAIHRYLFQSKEIDESSSDNANDLDSDEYYLDEEDLDADESYSANLFPNEDYVPENPYSVEVEEFLGEED